MPVDFFDNPNKETSDKSRFGLCDDVAPMDCPETPAYIDESNEEKWTAVVTNSHLKTATFYPIDNCIEILRPDGNMDKRCDGLLEYDNNLIFVELKDRCSKHGWVAEGLEQLKITINNFRIHHNINAFTSISAQLCNKQRPMAVVSCNTAVNQFKDETGYKVYVDRNITI